ncbi:unnamed protein product [Pleuronectes platessa]|uniref:Uncharacterized protein n=1 Tax=Pleuronectes platessa TaxID=8262 RepID=A0A9N7VHL1_PLEPL|nr:unnamed protein product [Pleuronectes platessa]
MNFSLTETYVIENTTHRPLTPGRLCSHRSSCPVPPAAQHRGRGSGCKRLNVAVISSSAPGLDGFDDFSRSPSCSSDSVFCASQREPDGAEEEVSAQRVLLVTSDSSSVTSPLSNLSPTPLPPGLHTSGAETQHRHTTPGRAPAPSLQGGFRDPGAEQDFARGACGGPVKLQRLGVDQPARRSLPVKSSASCGEPAASVARVGEPHSRRRV